jgi:hypothetical protein
VSTYEIAIEYKDRHLTRPMLQQIIGAALCTTPGVTEVIIRCRTAAGTALKAAEEIARSGNIINGVGRRVRVTLAPDYQRDE